MAGSASVVSTLMDEVIDLDKEDDSEEDQARLMEMETCEYFSVIPSWDEMPCLHLLVQSSQVN